MRTGAELTIIIMWGSISSLSGATGLSTTMSSLSLSQRLFLRPSRPSPFAASSSRLLSRMSSIPLRCAVSGSPKKTRIETADPIANISH